MSGPYDPVEVLMRLIDGRRTKSVWVAEVGSGVQAWLPRSQVTIEEGGMFQGSQKAPGTTLRVTMPRWLAEEKNLRTATDQRQAALF